MKEIPVAMAIAGSDSGGGAGIEADLKTFASFNVHGTVALTAVTAQNTLGVFGIGDVKLDLIKKQIDVVVEDIGVDAAKTGMLHRTEVIRLVSQEAKKYGFPLVVDPVMVSKSGARLLRKEAEETLKKFMVPIATVITPNAMEAEVLSGIRVATIEDMKEAAKKVSEMGCRAVVVKGGHAGPPHKAVDVLYVDGRFFEFEGERFSTNTTHGTGCGFSAAITACLAKGFTVVDAVREAKKFIQYAVEYGLKMGGGHGPINPLAQLHLASERHLVLEQLSNAISLLEGDKKVAMLIPEVQSNLVMSLPYPYVRGVSDVAGIPGRIVRLKDIVKASSAPEFGASSHAARIVLSAMEHDVHVRACMNIKYDPSIIKVCESLGYIISRFERGMEPEEVKKREGASLPWGIRSAISKAGRVPDIIYDEGDVGKEPMVRVLGVDAVEVAKKVLAIASRLWEIKNEED